VKGSTNIHESIDKISVPNSDKNDAENDQEIFVILIPIKVKNKGSVNKQFLVKTSRELDGWLQAFANADGYWMVIKPHLKHNDLPTFQ